MDMVKSYSYVNYVMYRDLRIGRLRSNRIGHLQFESNLESNQHCIPFHDGPT